VEETSRPRRLSIDPNETSRLRDSSLLNQIELWFGRIEREVVARGVFTSVKDLAASSCVTSIITTNKSFRQIAVHLCGRILSFQVFIRITRSFFFILWLCVNQTLVRCSLAE
jgi:hypothetical protein